MARQEQEEEEGQAADTFVATASQLARKGVAKGGLRGERAYRGLEGRVRPDMPVGWDACHLVLRAAFRHAG